MPLAGAAGQRRRLHIPLSAFVLFMLLYVPTYHALDAALDIGIGIGIGIGRGGSSPPPSAEPGCPPPPPPPPCNPAPPPVSPPPTTPPKTPPTTPPTTPRRSRPKPKPLIFENDLQKNAYRVIQRFRKTITADPLHITRTWRGAKVCNYKGFTCETPPNRRNLRGNMRTTAAIDFNSYRLRSKDLVGFVDKLPDLAFFHANSNPFSKAIPNLAGLQFFYELDLSNNRFSGAFPTIVLPLVNLTFLDLRFNSISGYLPSQVFLLNVNILFLNNNLFNGSIPANLGSSKVVLLTLANNNFTGQIPRSIGNLSETLQQVLLLNNRLSGCLPPEIGQLKKATLFDSGINQLTGPIPLSFACLRKMEQLNFARNLLYGKVPDEVCQLPKIKKLSLSNNYFTAVGESCLQLIRKGVLDVRRNCIRGLPEQRSPQECERFLARRKYCPLVKYVPCKLPSPWEEEKDDPLPAASGGGGRRLTDVYMALNAS